MSGLPDSALVASLKSRIRELEGIGTFADDAEERDKRRELYASAAATGQEVLDQVLAETFPSLADELLGEWRSELAAPNDAVRTVAEERARLSALLGGGWNRERLTAALALLGLTGDATLQTIESDLASLSAEAQVMLHLVLQVSESDWATSKLRRSIATLLRRIMPTRHLGQMGARDVSRQIVTSIGAQWGQADATDGNPAYLGRTTIGRFGGGYSDSGREPARLRSYGSLSTLEAEDLRAIMAKCLYFSPQNDGGFASAGIECMQRFGFFSVAGSGAATTLDQSTDWQDRLIIVTGRISGTDILPNSGGGNDAADAGSEFSFFWYTGTGGASYASPDTPGGGGAFRVSSGDLVYQADAGASTQYLYCQMVVSGKLGERDTANLSSAVPGEPVPYDLEDGDSLTAVNSFFPQLSDLWSWIPFDQVAAPSASYSDGHGGAKRFGVIVGEAGESYILDSRLDWRDRLITTVGIEWDPTRPLWPGLKEAADDEYDIELGECWYSGDGGGGVSGTWDHVFTGFADAHELWADPDSGALMITLDGTTPGKKYTVAVMAMATEQIGEYHGGGAKQLTGTTAIQPSDLNLMQDIGLWEQFMSDVGTYGSAPTNSRSDAMPLGPIATGDPPVPLAWALPVANRARGSRATWERRQRMADGHRIVWGLYVPFSSGEMIIDTLIDWRERFVKCAIATRSSDDIVPGGASDGTTGWGSATVGHYMLYMGTGEGEYEFEVDTDLFFYARPSDGTLVVRNDSGAQNKSFVLMAEVTAPLGTRVAS